MNLFNILPLLLGSAWASGINLYLTTAGLGIAHRMGWIELPGSMDTIAHPVIIGLAIILYAIEFVADKVPFVDSAWDSVHTFIRPLGGLVLGYMATADVNPVFQTGAALLTGTIALDSHLTKATSRAAINTSPEPISNSVASVTEDIGVMGAIYLIIKHPVIITLLVILFILFSIWFLKKMFKFLKKIFRRKDNSSMISHDSSI
ncbi:MAG: DUF4126 domain-containing protein [Candidatus Omnitrophica bacterium]|nr:DUF4126 domain-containing protein [Candidatus Omnitrophota bacterium]MCB9748313.1 DUF4126 domain-containing protein [Candidatus Omnitrophota bacterium]